MFFNLLLNIYELDTPKYSEGLRVENIILCIIHYNDMYERSFISRIVYATKDTCLTQINENGTTEQML